jgi:hypothetical protein
MNQQNEITTRPYRHKATGGIVRNLLAHLSKVAQTHLEEIGAKHRHFLQPEVGSIIFEIFGWPKSQQNLDE